MNRSNGGRGTECAVPSNGLEPRLFRAGRAERAQLPNRHFGHGGHRDQIPASDQYPGSAAGGNREVVQVHASRTVVTRSLFLVKNLYWHVAVSYIELLVEVGELPAGVLEEESSVECERRGEHIREQETTVGKDVCRIRPPDDDLQGDEKLEFTHKKERKPQDAGHSDEKRVGNHSVRGSYNRMCESASRSGLISSLAGVQ